MKPVIYVDLDGVLVDFVSGLAQVMCMSRTEMDQKIVRGCWDLHKGLGISEELMWKMIDKMEGAYSFWVNLKKTPDANDILDACEKVVGAENVCIMTSPPRNPNAVAAKAEWIANHLPDYKRRFAVTPAKHLFAHPGAILVDDSDANINKFVTRGGYAVLVPRLWNSLHEKADSYTHDDYATLLRSFVT